LRVFSRASRVFAFEPSPTFVTCLEKTFSAVSNVEILPLGLGDRAQDAYLAGNSLSGSVSEKNGVPIRITTIDRCFAGRSDRVDYIKGDLEGFELRVLQGAADTIRQFKPKIAFTVYHAANDWREILRYLHSLVPDYKYRLKGIYRIDEKPRPVMLHMWRE